MKRVCMCCEAILQEDTENEDKITHAVCDECKEEFIKECYVDGGEE